MAIVTIPIIPAAKDYLLSNFGPEPIYLSEGNEYYWILAKEYPYDYESLADSYSDKITLKVEGDLNITNYSVMCFSNFAVQRLHHLLLFQSTARPTTKKSTLLMDIMCENNLDPSMMATMKSFNIRFINKIKRNA